METIKGITEIILHKDEPLAKHLKDLQADTQEGFEKAKEKLLEVESIAIGISPYDRSRLNDINIGHWDLYRYCDANASSVRIPLFKELPARNPNADVKPNSVVAIDFGTKSTVVGIIDESGQKRLLRVGSRTSGEIKKEDYENPTNMEFRYISAFQIAYNSSKSRPLTAWNDLCISHTAANHQKEALAEDFSRFFSKLKQWAGYGKTYRVKDINDKTTSLKEFLHIEERDLNPVEIYAYYLARFINTMDNGIYTTYLLSYPDKFPKEEREQIRASFERGIKKAIPYAVLTNPQNPIKVEQIATEPAAYAICALDEYGFMREKFLKRSLEVYYGVFDFGGGTTDFDFGVLSLSQTKGYTFRLEHFGGGGDEKLGGENLLEFLAYEAFKQNLHLMRENGCKFSESPFPDLELNDAIRDQVDNSEEARRNSTAMAEKLRIIVENIQAYEDGELAYSFNDLNLYPSNGADPKVITIEVDTKKLIDLLTQKIQEGVEKFFQEFLATAKSHFPSPSKDDELVLRIFLGGNAARSPIVKEAFEALMKRESEGGISFELYAPLGTPEADDEIARQFGSSAIEQDLAKKVTCKTGVVFGLLESRPSNRRIEIISATGVNDDAKFKYFLGTGDAKEFSLVIDKNALHDGSKQLFLDHAHFTEYELLYTPDQRAADEKEDYSPKELNAKLKTIRLDKAYGEDDSIYIQAKGANGIQVSVISHTDSVLYSVDYTLE